MDKLHFVHHEFGEAWTFFKTFNPKTEKDWENGMEAANKFCSRVRSQNDNIGIMMEKIILAIIDYKESEYSK